MAVDLSPIGGVGAQFFDNNGIPLSGGKLYTYAAATTTPKACYTSAAGNVPHTNPIILDSAGRVPGGEIWLTSGEPYKFVLETPTSILLGTWDNIYGYTTGSADASFEVQTATAGQTLFVLNTMVYEPGTNTLGVYIDGVNQVVNNSYIETNSTSVTFVSGLHAGAVVKFVNVNIASTTANVVTYAPGFIGSVATTVEDKLQQTVSVKDFGAVGDGVADDTAAIQAAIAALGRLITNNPNASSLTITQVGGGTLFFPKGEYLVTASLEYSGGMTWQGENWGSSILFSPSVSSNCVNENTANKTWLNTQEGFSVKNMAFIAGNANAAIGLNLTNTQGIDLDTVTISGFASKNLYIGGTGGGGYYNSLNNVQLMDAPLNLHIDGTSLNSGAVTTVTGGFMFHSATYPAPSYNAIINATGVTFVGTSFEGKASVAQVLSQSIGLRFVNCYYENTATPLVRSNFTNGLAGNLMIEAAQSGVLALSNYPASGADANQFEQYIPISYFRGFPKYVPLVENGNFKYGILGWNRNNSGGAYGNGKVYLDSDKFGNGYASLRYEAAGTGNYSIRTVQTIPAAQIRQYAGGTQRVYFHVVTRVDDPANSSFQLNTAGAGLGNKFSTRADMVWGTSNEYRLYTISQTILDGTADLFLAIDFISQIAGEKGWVYGVWATIGGLDYLGNPTQDVFAKTAIPSVFDYATWNVGDKVDNRGWVFGQPVGWICKQAGTNGSLTATTANTTASSTSVVLSSVQDLGVGMYITIAGVTGIKKITALSGTTATVDVACDASVTGGAVAYSNAVFANLYTPV